jgi:hypothetical protein
MWRTVQCALTRGVWTRPTQIFAVAGLLAALCGITYWLTTGGTRGAELANVYALPIGCLGLVGTAISLLARPAPSDPAILAGARRTLRRKVGEQETSVQGQLLGDVGDPRPADVPFAQPALLHWRTDGGVANGTLSEILAYYQSLARGRLVILGSPGAGKTVTCIRLLLDLVAVPGPGRIPVRFNLPSFDPPEDADSADLSTEFERWLGAQIADTYGLNAKVAMALVIDRAILPILDGLDEMDAPGRPSRALEIVRMLNQQYGSQPVVVACRTENYSAMVAQMDDGNVIPVMQDATAVIIDPLTPRQIVDYIGYRFPSEAARWEPLTKFVNNYPDSALAGTLGRPLWLFLAVTAYAAPASAPAELLDLTLQDFNDRLMTQLVPSVVAFRAPGRRRAYDADVVMRFLRALAAVIRSQRTSGASSDIAVASLWRLVGTRAPLQLATSILLALVFDVLLTGMAVTYDLPDSLPQQLLLYTYMGAALALLPITYVRSWMAASNQTTRQPVERVGPEPTAARRVLIVLASVLSVLVLLCSGAISFLFQREAAGAEVEINPTLPMLVVVGIVTGTLLLILAVLSNQSDGAFIALPSRTLAKLRRSAIVPVLSALLLSCAVAISICPLWLDIGSSLTFTAFYIAPLALAAGICIGARSPWLILVAAEALLFRSGTTPDSLSRFLDWAQSAGLLRLTGNRIQFRHLEFQAWVDSRHDELRAVVRP